MLYEPPRPVLLLHCKGGHGKRLKKNIIYIKILPFCFSRYIYEINPQHDAANASRRQLSL